MMEVRLADSALLKTFSPLDGFKADNLHALARKTRIEGLAAGRLLFKAGDIEKRTFYLVSGSVELRAQDRVVAVIRGGSIEARVPIAPILPRKYTARAAEDSQFISLDSDHLDALLTWDQTGYYEASELSGKHITSADWMTILLQSRIFQRIPPANIQAIFLRMQRVNCQAGETIIKQGEDGDYFYVIVSGKCIVNRETTFANGNLKLAELGPGDSFGEEALIAECKRSATVEMLTDGALMRLGNADFQTLLNEPLLEWVDCTHARELIARGGKWLDVRLPSELKSACIDGALNVPLYLLRRNLNVLDPRTPYIVVCDTGRRSSAAAYILNERGFEVCILRGGVAAIADGSV